MLFSQGMTKQPSQSTDPFITEDLTRFLFARQADSFLFGQDLAARNIQRGRDHGTQVNFRSSLSFPVVTKILYISKILSLFKNSTEICKICKILNIKIQMISGLQ